MRKIITRCLLLAAAAGLLTGCHSAAKGKAETADQTKAVIEVTRRPEEETASHTSGQEAVGLEGLENGTDAMDQEGSEEQEMKNDITLLFGGDVLLSDHVLNAYEKAGGIHGVLDEGYRQVIQEADFFMVNQEFPFSDRGIQAEDKQFTFRLPPEKVSLFQEMGIDGVTLANNHALDFGQEALLDSAAVLDGAGILHTGAGENMEQAKLPITVDIRGVNIAVIGATRVIPEAGWAAGKNHAGMLATYDPAVLLEEIKELKEQNDYVIVFVHWGIERDEMPQDYQRTLGQQYIDAGADLVIGSHSHVLQGIEYYKGKPIVYSLGNFVFGSSIPKTALLQVTLPAAQETATADQGPAQISGSENGQTENGGTENGRTGGIALRLIPGTSGSGFTKIVTEEGKLQEFYSYMESISCGVTYDWYTGEVLTD